MAEKLEHLREDDSLVVVANRHMIVPTHKNRLQTVLHKMEVDAAEYSRLDHYVKTKEDACSLLNLGRLRGSFGI